MTVIGTCIGVWANNFSQMGKIDQTDIEFASRSFEELDKTGTGVIDINDVLELQDPATSMPHSLCIFTNVLTSL